MPAQKKRPSAAQRRQSQRHRGERPSPAEAAAGTTQPGPPRQRATPAADRGKTPKGSHSRSGRFFATLGKSRWPTIIVAALVVAALVASGIVLYAQPGGGSPTPAAPVLSTTSLPTLAPTPSASATP